MTNKSFIEKKLESWISSYEKDTNTYRVLLGKYPNILSIIQSALKELKKKEFKTMIEETKWFEKEVLVVRISDIEQIFGSGESKDSLSEVRWNE